MSSNEDKIKMLNRQLLDTFITQKRLYAVSITTALIFAAICLTLADTVLKVLLVAAVGVTVNVFGSILQKKVEDEQNSCIVELKKLGVKYKSFKK